MANIQAAKGLKPGGILDWAGTRSTSRQGRAQLSYDRNWNSKNALTWIGGAEIRETSLEGNSYRTYGYDVNRLTVTAADLVNTYPVYGSLSSPMRIPSITSFTERLHRNVSLFTNGAYTLLDKYTISASARKDASNLFGVHNNRKWAPLWSAGGAWELSRERFYRSKLLPYLKLRLTYGFSGNSASDLSAVTTITHVNSSTSNLNLPYARIQNAPNPQLGWEKVGMLNAGIEFRSKNETFSGSIEYYRKSTRDLLGLQPLDPTTGISSITSNSAYLEGRGVDVELHTKTIDRSVKWNTSLLLHYTSSRITRYLQKQADVASSFVGDGVQLLPVEGQRPYGVVSFRWAGLDGATGDPVGILDGAPSTDYAAIWNAPFSSLIAHGPSLPPWFGALTNTFRWKDLSLAANITGRFGYYFRRSTIDYWALYQNYQGHSDFARRWKKPGDEKSTSVPSMIYPADSYRDGFYAHSEATVEKGDHIRLEWINLSYGLDNKRWKTLPIQSAQVFIYANNLNILLWKANGSGLDPDYAYSLRPSPSISIGLKANF